MRPQTSLCLLFIALTSLVPACGKQQRQDASGGLVIRVESDLALPKDVDRITLEVTQAGKTLLTQDQAVGEGHLLLPADFFVAADGDSSPAQVRGIAYKDGAPLIERSAVTPIPSGRLGVVHLPLDYLCDGSADSDGNSTCEAGETCVQGSCTSALVPDSEVTTPDDASSDAGSAATCFDVLACFAGAKLVPLDPETCSVSLPSGSDSAQLNVALALTAPNQGVCDDKSTCWVVLDQGAGGWTVSDSRVQLPASVCQKPIAQGSIQVALSSACQGKPPHTPACGTWSSAPTPIESPPAPTPVTPACEGASSEACGQCGMRSRTCTNGQFSTWSACAGEGACTPGDTSKCGSGGTRSCARDCAWGACQDQTCSGATSRSCGNCGTQHRSCDNGTWSNWEDCKGEGECKPDATESCSGGGKHTCGGDCHFSACIDLPCTGVALRACGACGNQTRTCNGETGTWSSWTACTAEGACQPNDTQACGSGGSQACGGNCQWAACTGQSCVGASSATCGKCGTQTRTCDNGAWSSWTACAGEGACAASSSMTCGGTGTETCSSACQWGACSCAAGNTLCNGQCVNEQTDAAHCGGCSTACVTGSTCQAGACSCSGATSQACGNCGTQTRTCSATGTWSAWSSCSGQGACAPAASQSCSGGTQTCSAKCQWNTCCDPSPYTVVSATVAHDPSKNLDWQRLPTGTLSYAKAVTTCSALGTGWHVPNMTQLDSLITQPNAASGGSTVNSCAFPMAFDTLETYANPQSLNHYVNRYWTSDSFTPQASWNCATVAHWVSDLWTGYTSWGACVEESVAQVLCVH